MTYHINSGIVKKDGIPLPAELLYKKGRIEATVNDKVMSIIIAKRPANLNFHFHIDPHPHFTISFKGEKLNQRQINTLVSEGYFLSKTERIYFTHAKIREYVAQSCSDMHTATLIKFLRVLVREKLCPPPPHDLLEKLRVQSKTSATHKKLFTQSLYPYQEKGVDWLSFCVNHGIGTILADDMGLGKTAQIIALCCDTLANNANGRILIVVPNPLLDNWKREFTFFAPKIEIYIHYGSERRGLSTALESYSVIITPYTTMASDITMLEELSFELAVFDEASMLKNPCSARSNAARRLNFNVAVAMTGTPVENSLMDAWSLCDLVFPNYLENLSDFKSRYVHRDISRTLSSNLEELENSLRQITLRRMKKDVLDQLPQKLDIHTPISQNEKEKTAYNNIIKEMKDDEQGSNILPLINKLQQFTAHPALLNAEMPTDLRSLVAQSAKFEMLLLKLSSIALSKEKVIIFATFQKVIDLIRLAIKDKYKISPGVIDGRTPNCERQSLIDKFTIAEGFNVLILHPKTAGMGLNITAATHVIHYCRQWNPALEEQATARAWRNGQKAVVSVYYMFYADTVEETIDTRLRLKQQLSDRVISLADDKETDKQIMLEYLEKLDS